MCFCPLSNTQHDRLPLKDVVCAANIHFTHFLPSDPLLQTSLACLVGFIVLARTCTFFTCQNFCTPSEDNASAQISIFYTCQLLCHHLYEQKTCNPFKVTCHCDYHVLGTQS
jgi:hypothetical protein